MLVGALLLSNRLVPLAVVVLAPDGVGMACFILAVHLFLAWMHRSAYRPLLTVRAPSAA